MAGSAPSSEPRPSGAPGFRLTALLSVLLLGCFCMLAVAISAGHSLPFDGPALLWLRQPGDPALSRGPFWLGQLMRDFSALVDVPMRAVIVMFAAGGLAAARRWRMGLFLAVALAGGAAYETLLKHLFQRARPGVVPHLVEVHSLSFPSGHATFASMLFLTLGALSAREMRSRVLRAYVIACAIMLTLSVGVSRVWLGVHWPSDVLAGWLAGSAYALLMIWAATRLQDLGWIERRGEPSPPRRPV